MRIVIDMQGAQGENRQRGIGRYTVELVRAVLQLQTGHHIILALNGMCRDSCLDLRRRFAGMMPEEDIKTWSAVQGIAAVDSNNQNRRKAARTVYKTFLNSLKPDVVLVSSLFEGYGADCAVEISGKPQPFPTVVILYDLIPYLFPHLYLDSNWSYSEFYRECFGQLLQADGWLAISQATANDGVEQAHLPGKAVWNIGAGVEDKFQIRQYSKPQRSTILQSCGISRNFVLYTGGIVPRKNIQGLLKAFGKLEKAIRSRYQLVIVCHVSEDSQKMLQGAVKQAGLKTKEVVFTGYVSDEQLVALYNLCSLFVFPSLYEGFGLPVLEAYRCGAPVIASSRSSLPELTGMAEAMFDPDDSDEQAELISRALQDAHFCGRLRANGKRRCREFSWEKSAAAAVKALEETVTAAKKKQKELPAQQTKSRQQKALLAYISPLPPEQSGISNYSAELLPLLEQYYRIELISDLPGIDRKSPGRLFKSRTTAYFQKNRVKYDRVLYHFGNSAFHATAFRLLMEIPGVVVLHDFYLSGLIHYLEYHGGWQGCWQRELFFSHGYAALLAQKNSSDPLEPVWNYPVNRTVLQCAKQIIVHSDYSRRLAAEWYCAGDDWLRIPHLRQIRDKKNSWKECRHIPGVKKAETVVCSFGFLGENKCNERLLRVWLETGLTGYAYLIFVGEVHDPEYRLKLERLIRDHAAEERVRITGYVTGQQYDRYLEAADVAVQLRTLSRGESSGAVLDVLAAGVPLLINDNGSMAEIPGDAACHIEDQFTDQQLIEKLFLLIKNKRYRAQLARQAVEYIRKEHDPEKCAAAYCEAIESAYRWQDYRSLAGRFSDIQDETERCILSEAVAVSFPRRNRPPQLLIDISELHRRDVHTGIQRVVRNIMKQWLCEPPQGYAVEPVYAEPGRSGYRYAQRFTAGMLDLVDDFQEDDQPIEFAAGDLFLGLDLQLQAVVEQEPFLQKMQCHGVKVIFTVYDLLPVTVPHCFPGGADIPFEQWLHCIAQFDGAVTISATVKEKLKRWITENTDSDIRPFEIEWFHLGSELDKADFCRESEQLFEKLEESLTGKTVFLMTGTLEPRKGHRVVLDAFEKLWKVRDDVGLVIVGRRGWMVERVVDRLENSPYIGKQLFWLQDASDYLLEQCYQLADCLIAASEDEGFGLPLIEAAARGVPVLMRDIPVFREVAGDGGIYFDGSADDCVRRADEIITRIRSGAAMPLISGVLNWKESSRQCWRAVQAVINRGRG